MTNIKDVAKKANVGIATVSRVINNSGFVSAETRTLVLQAINELGYVPNELARNFKRKQTNFIGIIVPQIDQPFTTTLLAQLERDLSQQGYFVLLFVSNHNGEKELEYLEKLNSQQVVGTIITAPFANEKIFAKYSKSPIVSFDRIINANIPCVSIDNYKAAWQLTERLLKKTDGTVVYVGFGADSQSLSEERRQAFIDLCSLKKRPFIIFNKKINETARTYLLAVYQKTKNYTSFFFACDDFAQIFINIAQQDGIKVGHDIFLVGFDGLPTNNNTHPLLTTVIQDVHLLSQALIAALFFEPQDKKTNSTIVIKHTIFNGETC